MFNEPNNKITAGVQESGHSADREINNSRDTQTKGWMDRQTDRRVSHEVLVVTPGSVIKLSLLLHSLSQVYY